jgi:DNA-binding MarR family transcriptional regulator
VSLSQKIMLFKPSSAKLCLNFKSKQLARALTRLYDAELSKAGLKTTQFTLLAKVFNQGPIPPGKLAILMELEKSTMTRNLQPMIKAGLVEFEMNLKVRRKVISLTQTGRDKFIEADMYWNTAQQIVAEILGNERVNALYTLMDESLDIINRAEV